MIVDDEKMAIKVIVNHIQHIEGLEVVSTHSSAMEALTALQSQAIDILFLDIQMPKISGLSFLKSIPNPPYVVLTTAHREYALDGYELDIVDYLLKPISFERFMKTVAKIFRWEQKQMSATIPVASTLPSTSIPFIYIKSDRQYIKVLLDEVCYIESIKNHVIIVTPKQKYITLLSISQMDEKLPQQDFLRIHRSFIIAINKIDQYSNSNVLINEKLIPIGRLYKKEVLDRLKLHLL